MIALILVRALQVKHSVPSGAKIFKFPKENSLMKLRFACVVFGFLSLALSLAPLTLAQTSTQTASALPRLVRFGGTAKDLNGSPLIGVVGITFALYSEQTGGASLWLETQNVTADSTGHYAVLLGSTKPDGLPTDLFTSEQARWVGVQISGQAEQARVLLVSAPYALKAGDAETIGGLPPSAFVLAAPGNSGGVIANSSGVTESSASVPPPASSDVTTTGGAVNAIPLFSTATNIQNSILTQTAATAVNVGGKLNLPPAGTATSSAGFNSRPQDFVASVFNSGTATAVPQTFQWQAEPLNNDKSTATGTLNLLYATGTATPAETGLKISNKGTFTFAAGQAFPGTGDGSVTSVATGLGLKGGPITKTGTLTIDTTVVPQLAVANTFKAEQTITASNTTQIVNVTQTGTGLAIVGKGGVSGSSTADAGSGVLGVGSGQAGYGVYGSETATIGNGYGVYGVNNTQAGAGVEGYAANTSYGIGVLGNSPSGIGVEGTASGTASYGVFGWATATSGTNYGVYGSSASPTGAGVYGIGATGVGGASTSTSGPGGGFTGFTAPSGSDLNGTDGVVAMGGNVDAPSNSTTAGNGVVGIGGALVGPFGEAGAGVTATGGTATAGGEGITASGDGIDAYAGAGGAGGNFAGNFIGNVSVSGALSASTKDFKIDHPLDPANKYLVHASVESSEMKNIYDGNVTTDGQGHATVQLPEWFEALNTDFRYQLTVIGQFAQAIIGRKIENNQFEIRTSAPNVEVSWQVTGVRQDAFAKANPLVVEQEKEPRLRGFYIHPDLYGAPPEKQIEWARHPQTMKKIQEMRAKQLAASQKQAAPRN
jgi:hypothetical protein